MIYMYLRQFYEAIDTNNHDTVLLFAIIYNDRYDLMFGESRTRSNRLPF